MTVLPCEWHRSLSAELQGLIQSTTEADELQAFTGDTERLRREIQDCADCKRVERGSDKGGN